MTDGEAIDQLYKHHLELQNQFLKMSGQLLTLMNINKALLVKVDFLQKEYERLTADFSQISKN